MGVAARAFGGRGRRVRWGRLGWLGAAGGVAGGLEKIRRTKALSRGAEGACIQNGGPRVWGGGGRPRRARKPWCYARAKAKAPGAAPRRRGEAPGVRGGAGRGRTKGPGPRLGRRGRRPTTGARARRGGWGGARRARGGGHAPKRGAGAGAGRGVVLTCLVFVSLRACVAGLQCVAVTARVDLPRRWCDPRSQKSPRCHTPAPRPRPLSPAPRPCDGTDGCKHAPLPCAPPAAAAAARPPGRRGRRPRRAGCRGCAAVRVRTCAARPRTKLKNAHTQGQNRRPSPSRARGAPGVRGRRPAPPRQRRARGAALGGQVYGWGRPQGAASRDLQGTGDAPGARRAAPQGAALSLGGAPG
ncbi:MAG: hypothetical protein J3K34DRAFT_419775 [Monoraphidium minutum]|nr:MAG: hypothetical protein J3K34DRAFT_419775 [Monoraphidium minutum]